MRVIVRRRASIINRSPRYVPFPTVPKTALLFRALRGNVLMQNGVSLKMQKETRHETIVDILEERTDCTRRKLYSVLCHLQRNGVPYDDVTNACLTRKPSSVCRCLSPVTVGSLWRFLDFVSLSSAWRHNLLLMTISMLMRTCGLRNRKSYMLWASAPIEH